jgi:hypothetical protein
MPTDMTHSAAMRSQRRDVDVDYHHSKRCPQHAEGVCFTFKEVQNSGRRPQRRLDCGADEPSLLAGRAAGTRIGANR